MVVTAAVVVAAYCGSMAVAACCGSVAVATCCDSVAVAALNGAPLVKAAALPVAGGALDERRLVGTAASDLSTLAGARGARSASPCEHKGGKIKHPLLEDGVPRGAIPHLRVEKPRLLFLEGSTGTEGAAGVAAAAPPNASAAHAGTSVARAGTSAARAASIIDCLATGAPAPAPDACFLAASAALDEGARDPTSRGELAPRRPLPPPLLTTSLLKSPGERVPAARAAGTPRLSVPGAPASGSSSPSCMPPAPAPAAAPRARPGSGRGWIGPRGVHDHHLQGTYEISSHADASRINRKKGWGGNPLTNRP
jgi:hypothetical protein